MHLKAAVDVLMCVCFMKGRASSAAGKAKKVNEYYEHQQELYNGYAEVDKLDGVDARWVPDTTQVRRPYL